MRAIILAAGFGTRLRPLTDTIPKPLLPVGGKPLVLWNLQLLRQHGITDVIVNLHYLGEQIAEYLGDGSHMDMRIHYSREEAILGTGGGIKQAEEFLRGSSSEAFLILNGDTLMDINLTDLMRYHHTHGGLATMVIRDDLDVHQWGALELDDNSRVVKILGRGATPEPENTPHRQVMFAGAHIIDPALLQDIPVGEESSIITPYMERLENGAKIYGHHLTGYWSDVGTPERYDQAEKDAQAGKLGWIRW